MQTLAIQQACSPAKAGVWYNIPPALAENFIRSGYIVRDNIAQDTDQADHKAKTVPAAI